MTINTTKHVLSDETVVQLKGTIYKLTKLGSGQTPLLKEERIIIANYLLQHDPTNPTAKLILALPDKNLTGFQSLNLVLRANHYLTTIDGYH